MIAAGTFEMTFTLPSDDKLMPIALLEAVLKSLETTRSGEEIDLVVEFVMARRRLRDQR